MTLLYNGTTARGTANRFFIGLRVDSDSKPTQNQHFVHISGKRVTDYSTIVQRLHVYMVEAFLHRKYFLIFWHVWSVSVIQVTGRDAKQMYSSAVVKHSFEVHVRLLYTSTTLHFKRRCCTFYVSVFLCPICHHHSTVSCKVPPTARSEWLQVKRDGNKRMEILKWRTFIGT